MSLGLKSIWRTRSRCNGGCGPLLVLQGLTCNTSLIIVPSFTRRLASAANSHSLDPIPSTDIELRAQLRAELVETKHARNDFFRRTFRASDSTIEEAVEQKLNSPFVPTIRDYPSTSATKASRNQALKIARTQVAFDTIARHFSSQVPRWPDTFNLLKRITPKRSETPKMAAMRIVLPKSWDLAVSNKKVEFVDSTTGLAAKLRVSADHHNPYAIVLRGKSEVLAKAADEMIAACKDVEVFRLGDLAAFDYEAKRLWPAIEGALDGGSSLPAAKVDSIWVHKELQTYWIDKPYEQTPRPTTWTKDTFETYITTLVCGRLRSDLALPFYQQRRRDGKLIDTEGIRVNLIMQAFEDPTANAHVTTAVLKMAMAFIVRKGGHRAAADRLFTLAEQWGVPMDTDVFNIILDGYVNKRDVALFHKFLSKMDARYFHPNAKTWLLFLELVQNDDERRQVIAAMYELDLFDDPATRRGIALVMASHDAYTAFKAGKKIDVFMADQTTRYGDNWLTVGSLNVVLKEFLRFHRDGSRQFNDFKPLVEAQSENGRKLDVSIIDTILQYCAEARDWDTAFWALKQLSQNGCEPSHQTYTRLVSLALSARSPNALAVAFFYAVLTRKLRRHGRLMMRNLLLGRVPSPFWSEVRPKILSKKMARALEQRQVLREANTVASVERAILEECNGYVPVKSLAESLEVAFQTMDRPLHQRRKNAAASQQEVRVPDFVMKLVDPTGQAPKMLVHLDACFDPAKAVKGWDSKSVIEEATEDASSERVRDSIT